MAERDDSIVRAIESELTPIRWEPDDYDRLLEMIGDRRIVLLGEASHGTHEFYRERAAITRRLIEERGFTIVAVEADWPDAYRANRFVRGMSEDADAVDALGEFHRFPRWMWRNTEVADFLDWLQAYNRDGGGRARPAGFYGLDLYSLHASMRAVLDFLDEADPEAAQRARYRYSCFDHFGEDSQAYGYAASFGMTKSCEDQALQQLLDLQRNAGELAARDGRIPEDEFFFAEQNARLVKNAEEYYRTMFHGRVSSWNLRDRHMVETLGALIRHFAVRGEPPKVVVWAHNSHLGDARATEMGQRGEWNVGQLVREEHGEDAFLVGFTTATGTVTAAHDWDGEAHRKRVRSPLPGSYEALFAAVGAENFLLGLGRETGAATVLREPRLERAIGVIYRPQTERLSHYFHASLPRQFDAVLHFDETLAVEPLDIVAGWHEEDAPETYPFNV